MSDRPDTTTASKKLVCGHPPLHDELAPARSKQMGCLSCPVLPTVRGVTIGADYKGANKKVLDSVRPDVDTHKMPGWGPVPAETLVVLESPSIKEDVEGRACVGRDAGTLKQGITEAGADWKDMRFVHAVRCRAKKPTLTAVKACNGFLHGEILKTDPKIIVPVGALALKAVVGPAYRINACAGTPFKAKVAGKKRIVFPIMSPGYIMVNDTAAPRWQMDLDRLNRVMTGEEQVAAGMGRYTEVASARDAIRMLDSIVDGDCAVDLETNTLDPREQRVKVWRGLIDEWGNVSGERIKGVRQRAKISVVSWTTKPGEGYYVLRDHMDSTWTKRDRRRFDKALKRLLRRRSVRKVFWNAMFEQTWFRVHLGTHARNYIDAMLVHHQALEERGHGLDDAAQHYTSMGAWTDAIKFWQKAVKYNMSCVPKAILGPYAGADVDATLRVLQRVYPELDKRRARIARVFYPALIDALSEMEALGQHGDRAANALFTEYTKLQTDVAEKELRELPVLRRYERRKKREDEHPGTAREWFLNFNSPPQIAEILFGELKYEPFALTKKKQPKTDKESLNWFVKTRECKFSESFLVWRKYEKQHSTYAVKLLAQLDRFDDYIRGHFKPHGTVTGRLSATNPNLQNQPDVARFMYTSKFGEDGCIVQLDYSQIEVRVAACLSKDPLLLEVYRKGGDVHTATAARMFHIPIEEAIELQKSEDKGFKRLRTIAKRIVFGVIYGIGADGIVRTCRKEGIDITIDEARDYISKFFRVYKGLRRWIDKTIEKIHETGYTLSPTGRRRHLPDVWSADEEKVARAGRQGPNAVIQGTASDFTTTAIIYINRAMRRHGFKSRMTMTVHDSIVLDCLRTEAARVVRLCKQIMENIHKLSAGIWGKDMDWSWVRCPIVAEAEIGVNWRDGVKFDPDDKSHDVDSLLTKSLALRDERNAKMTAEIKELRKRVAA